MEMMRIGNVLLIRKKSQDPTDLVILILFGEI